MLNGKWESARLEKCYDKLARHMSDLERERSFEWLLVVGDEYVPDTRNTDECGMLAAEFFGHLSEGMSVESAFREVLDGVIVDFVKYAYNVAAEEER